MARNSARDAMAVFLIAALVSLAGAVAEVQHEVWKPPACEELAAGVPCRTLYEHPQGSTFVGPFPVETYTSTDGCEAQFEGKTDAEKCPQIECGEALGVKFKLICGG